MHLHFINALLCDNGELIKGELWVNLDSGKIVAPAPQCKHTDIDLHGAVLAPGFLDVQINGIYGLNFSDLKLSDLAAIKAFKQHYNDAMTKYLSTGVTSLCPTVTSNFPEVYKHVLPIIGPSRSNYQVDSLGAHLEGPFISGKKKGCHPVETLVDAHEGIEKVYQVYGGKENMYDNVRIVTAAPEIPGVLEAIPELTENNVVYSIGHTTADYETGLQAIEKGATMVTHLYNAMPQPHHREVGVVGLVSSPVPFSQGKETPYFGLIADGVHVDASMCVLAYRAAPQKCMLVTDAMHLIGLPDGTYQWDAQRIVKNGASLKLEGTDTLAGAATGLDACIRNVVKWTGSSLAQVVANATNVPATAVGVSSTKGYLNVGCDADLVVMDVEGYIKEVYKLGNRVSTTRSSSAKITAQL